MGSFSDKTQSFRVVDIASRRAYYTSRKIGGKISVESLGILRAKRLVDRIAHTCISESEKVGREEEKPEIRNWLCVPRTPPMVTTSRLQFRPCPWPIDMQ